ncbi:MAG: type II secretion system F family protein [Elusimicrobiaceae bacterium]|nr:type II secretion system F family protein [Elusimicrobiaceae bacterium]
MKDLKTVLFFFIATLILGQGVCLAQQVLTDKQTQTLKCAEEKIYTVYNFLNVDKPSDQKTFTPSQCGKSKPIPMPAWLEKALPEMAKKQIWQQDTDTGTQSYSEAQIWQRAFNIIHEYLALADGINEGTAYTSQEIKEQFGYLRTRFLITLDIIASEPAFYDSMEGRGRQIIATLELINKEMVSVGESFVVPQKQWRSKFRKSIMGVAILSNSIYSTIMMKQWLAVAPARFKKPNNQAMLLILTMLGTLLVFSAVLMIMNNQNDAISGAIDKYLQKTSVWVDDYNRQFIRINIKYMVVATVVLFILLGVMFAMALGGIFGFIVLFIFFGIGLHVGLKMPGSMLKVLKKQRGNKINKQLMDALILLSNSLKSGMDIVQGFEMVSKDLRPPISEEFALVIKNYNLGTPFERSLEMMEERVDSRLLSYMVKAIVLQRQVGGNLTKIFERIVENIREESKLEEKLQAMTAQQRIQAIVVGIMPWIMVGVMFIFQPDTMINFYTTPIGIVVLLFCIIWIFIGIKAVNKLGEIKV